MANALRGEATIEALGEVLTLRLDFNTFCSIEDDTGIGIEELGEALSNKPTAKLLRTVFWACLQKYHPHKNQIDAGEILSELGMAGIEDALTRLFKVVMPDPQKTLKRPATQRAGTGKN